MKKVSLECAICLQLRTSHLIHELNVPGRGPFKREASHECACWPFHAMIDRPFLGVQHLMPERNSPGPEFIGRIFHLTPTESEHGARSRDGEKSMSVTYGAFSLKASCALRVTSQ